MLKYVSKFVLDILPSLVATVIGAYIVNHYIIPKPATNAPAATAASIAMPKVEVKAPDIPAEAAAGAEPTPIKGKPAIEKAAVEKALAEKNTGDKIAEKPSDTAGIPAESRRRPSSAREKSVAKAVPTAAPAPAPIIAAPNTAAVDNTPNADERRDASDLARAAIERLRASGEPALHAARAPEPPRIASPQPVQALPPAIMISTPRAEPFNSTTGSLKSADTPASPIDDSHRPPANIPVSQPIDLHAETTAPSAQERTTVADEMLSAAKSVFQAVLPR